MNNESNAVLTPHLIHPNFFKKKSNLHTSGYRTENCAVAVSNRIKAERKQWCLAQAGYLANHVSNAVLGK